MITSQKLYVRVANSREPHPDHRPPLKQFRQRPAVGDQLATTNPKGQHTQSLGSSLPKNSSNFALFRSTNSKIIEMVPFRTFSPYRKQSLAHRNRMIRNFIDN